MTRKTLEDKIPKELDMAKEKLGAKYSPLIETLGFNLSYGESKVGLYDKNAKGKEKKKDCLVAYVCELTNGPKLEPAVLEHLKKYVFKDEFEGFKLYVVGSGPIIAYAGAIKKPEPKPAYGVPFPPKEPVPAYGVPLPPKDKKKKKKKD